MQFRKPTIEDKEMIDFYLAQKPQQGCEFTFANIFLWSSYYKVEFAVEDDMLLFKSGVDEQNREGIAFAYPIGSGDVKKSVEKLIAYAKEEGIPFSMYDLTNEMKDELSEFFPDSFEYTPDRDSFDYIYNSSDLIELKGKKYHGKRNHINKFKENDWSYETISRENMDECLEMNRLWCLQNGGCTENDSKQAEQCVIRRYFKYYEKLGVRGGLLRQNGRVVAFTLGEPVSDEMFVVHIEKAFADVQGAYPTINQEFVTREASGYRYINREEDMGIEGLRKAKLSYHPAFLLEKYTAVLK